MILLCPKFDKANLTYFRGIAGFVEYISQIDKIVFSEFIQGAPIRSAIAFMAGIKDLEIFCQGSFRYLIPSFENPPLY